MFAKKSLGQNFLKSKAALDSIIRSADISDSDTILEIGPGKGVLTERLLEKAGKVIVVEKDDRLIAPLQSKFHEKIAEGKLKIVYGDILDTDPKVIDLEEGKYKIVANIPYYITGQLLRIFLSGNIQPSKMVLMLQKEVAERIVARDGKESLLSISVKAYGDPHYIEKVAKKYFSPQPKVDSAILLIDNISKNFFTDPVTKEKISEEKFFKVVKAGFAHKRKQLAGNLKEHFKSAPLENILTAVGIDKKIRAENLSLEHWKYLIQKI